MSTSPRTGAGELVTIPIIIFETWQSFEPSNSIFGGSRRMRPLPRKFNSEQLLLEAFSVIICKFGSVQL